MIKIVLNENKGIVRNKEVIYGKQDLETLLNLSFHFIGVTQKKSKTDKFFKMRWQISRGSGMLQLNPLLPLKVLYPKTHNSGCIGKLWEEHHRVCQVYL